MLILKLGEEVKIDGKMLKILYTTNENAVFKEVKDGKVFGKPILKKIKKINKLYNINGDLYRKLYTLDDGQVAMHRLYSESSIIYISSERLTNEEKEYII